MTNRHELQNTGGNMATMQFQLIADSRIGDDEDWLKSKCDAVIARAASLPIDLELQGIQRNPFRSSEEWTQYRATFLIAKNKTHRALQELANEAVGRPVMLRPATK